MLQVQLHQAQTEQEALEETEEFTMPSPETTIPIEEFEELHMKLDETENKVNELESELAMKESTIAKLTAKADKLSTDLEKAKDQIERLKHDLTDQKRQSIAAASRASDLAGHQLAIMQEEMKAKIETAKKEAYEQALRDAEGQQDKDDGKFEKEVARRQALEEKLRKVGISFQFILCICGQVESNTDSRPNPTPKIGHCAVLLLGPQYPISEILTCHA
jgi:uncharacterized coiled-coil protein SlyX